MLADLKVQLNKILERKVGMIKFLRSKEPNSKILKQLNELEEEVRCIAQYQIEADKAIVYSDKYRYALECGVEWKRKYETLQKFLRAGQANLMVKQGWISEEEKIKLLQPKQ